MCSRIKLYSNKDGEIYRFLTMYYNKNYNTYLHALEWENYYYNPVEIASILGVFIDNSDNFNISMWLNLDRDVFINITEDNANDIIKYLYERFPY